jgi:membrane protein DedA with SNARE-associated domain
MSIVFLFTFGEAIFDNVFNWADYFFIGVLCLIPVGYIGYRLIRRRKRKKIEES